jgi:polysaccharide deacetylase family protein (PEP-CTERM system associated)
MEAVEGADAQPPHRKTPGVAFCVDVEEWFHSFGFLTPLTDRSRWDDAPSCVVRDTETIMRLLDERGVRGTFLILGWVARKYPGLVRRLASEGHEIGCHGYWHDLIYTLTEEQFRADVSTAVRVLEDAAGGPVRTYRAPSFSMTSSILHYYDILAECGITTDVSVMPAARDYGGIASFPRDPFLLRTRHGKIRCFPVSVMEVLGRRVPFSGGGYLRLLPLWVMRCGFSENLAAGRPGMSYIHPREVNPAQPRLDKPPVWRVAQRLKYFKYYVNLASTQRKLRHLLQTFEFTTVGNVLDAYPFGQEYEIRDGKLTACRS